MKKQNKPPNVKKDEVLGEMEGRFIYYDGKYWLIEKFDKDLYGGGFFAVPLYFNKDRKAEVRHGAAKWCYVSNGAIVMNPEKNVMIEAFESQLSHLSWCKDIQMRSTDYYEDEMSKINQKIRFYQNLLRRVNAKRK